MSQLTERFKNFCKELDGMLPTKEVTVDVVLEPRYNIYKRSLPVGINKPVYFNLRKREADLLLQLFLKTKLDEATKQVTYYDLVPTDAVPAAQSIYFNEGPVTREA